LIIRLNGKANGFQKDADGIVRYQLIYHPACRVFLCLGVLKNSPELHTPYKNELKIKQKSNLFSVMLKKIGKHLPQHHRLDIFHIFRNRQSIAHCS